MLTLVKALLRFIPKLAIVVSLLTRSLTTILPDSVIRLLIRVVMKSPPDGVVESTLSFLKSRNGVRQAMYIISIPKVIYRRLTYIVIDTWEPRKCKPSPLINGPTMYGALQQHGIRLPSSSFTLDVRIIGLRTGRGTRSSTSAGGR